MPRSDHDDLHGRCWCSTTYTCARCYDRAVERLSALRHSPRPTIRVMTGGETGNETCRKRDDDDWKGCLSGMATCGPDGLDYFTEHTKCPAPTPEAP